MAQVVEHVQGPVFKPSTTKKKKRKEKIFKDPIACLQAFVFCVNISFHCYKTNIQK
jgi:hypothetical protein